jgi:solute carrier family 35 protein F5
MFSLYLFGFAIFPEWRGARSWPTHFDPPSSSNPDESSKDTSKSPTNSSISSQIPDSKSDGAIVTLDEDAAQETEPLTKQLATEAASQTHYTWQQTAKISLMFCPLWFIANSTFNASLLYTSVSSSSILSATSSFFTLLFGVIFGAEQFSFGKLAAVFFCLGGVALVTVSDEETAGVKPLLGDALAVFGALSYGAYTVFLAKKIPNERQVSMPMFFGFVGLFNVCLLWPFFIILHFTGLEPFALPDKVVLLSLSLNGLFGTVLSDLLWSLVVVFASPLLATMGLSLGIPLAMASDAIMGKRGVFTGKYFIGSALVLLGFTTVNLTSKEREERFYATVKSKCNGQPIESPLKL